MSSLGKSGLVALGLVAVLLILAVVGALASGTGWYGGMMGRGAAMGPGMMGGFGIAWLWMLLVPILLLLLLVLGVIWLAQQIGQPRAGNTSGGSAVPCPHCGRIVQVGWLACPYCGASLATGEPPQPSST